MLSFLGLILILFVIGYVWDNYISTKDNVITRNQPISQQKRAFQKVESKNYIPRSDGLYIWNFSGQGKYGSLEVIHVALFFLKGKIIKIEGAGIVKLEPFEVKATIEEIHETKFNSDDIGEYEITGNKIKITFINNTHNHISRVIGRFENNGIIGEISKEGYSYDAREIVKEIASPNALFKFFSAI